MRRKDREVTDLNQIFDIVSRCSVAHVGMTEHGKPYVVALNFGYERKCVRSPVILPLTGSTGFAILLNILFCDRHRRLQDKK